MYGCTNPPKPCGHVQPCGCVPPVKPAPEPCNPCSNRPKPCGCVKPCNCKVPPVKPAPEPCNPGSNRPKPCGCVKPCGCAVPPVKPAPEPCTPCNPGSNRPKPCGCVKPCGCAVPPVKPAPEPCTPCNPGSNRPKPCGCVKPCGCAVPPVKPAPEPCNAVEWVATTPQEAECLNGRAVVAGYDTTDGSPLWVIRSYFNGELLPGKLEVKHHKAFVSWEGREYIVCNFEVCCACLDNVRWVEDCNGNVPYNAVGGGHVSTGEALYIGRAREQCCWTPGKILPSHGVLYIPYSGKEIPYCNYEVLCIV